MVVKNLLMDNGNYPLTIPLSIFRYLISSELYPFSILHSQEIPHNSLINPYHLQENQIY
jgi:hypothetical protein